jgi:hypothetical protein
MLSSSRHSSHQSPFIPQNLLLVQINLPLKFEDGKSMEQIFETFTPRQISSLSEPAMNYQKNYHDWSQEISQT